MVTRYDSAGWLTEQLMTKRTIELTRRKILASAGAVGAAGAGAGFGTSALFSDEEEFTNNTITAGDLNLAVSYTTEYDGAGTVETDSGTIDGQPGILFNLQDVKPGDSGRARICVSVVDNPAWVWLQSGIATDAENGVTEPESDVDDDSKVADPTAGTSQSGELAEALTSTWWYETTSNLVNDSADPTISGDVFADDFNAGVRLDGDPSTSGLDPFAASTSAPPYPHCIAFEWELPISVGNEVQSDSVTFPVRLFAEQFRNNTSPDNPVANVQI